MSSEFLGTGWSFPVAVDGTAVDGATGSPIRAAVHEQSIQQSIWMILGTSKGERLMRPDFGCGIHDLVFATSTAGTAGRVQHEVTEALLRWEPRIDVDNVSATIDPGAPNALQIEIDYRVRTTNNRFNLVYPFYLE